VCSGIEAASVAWEPLGWSAAWLAEIEPFPSRVLAHRFPQVPNLGDMTAIADRIRAGEVERPDVLVGGTPCQAFSVAGLRRSLDDARGNLTLCFAELVDACSPAFTVWENVPGVLSTKDNAFGCLLGALAGSGAALEPHRDLGWTDAGLVAGPGGVAAWRILDAQFFGLAQRRLRVFVVRCPRGGRDPGEILFESPRLRWDPPPRSKAGQGVAHGTAQGAGVGIPDPAYALSGGGTRFGSGRDAQDTFAVQSGGCFDVAGTLQARDGSATQRDVESGLLIPFDTTQMTSRANRSTPRSGDPCHPLSAGAHAPAAAFRLTQDPISGEVSPAMSSGNRQGCATIGVQSGAAVRRLTPCECEALQGFTRGYTAIPGAADGPRYRALGNSMAVPVMRWIGEQIARSAKRATEAA
jgi:DNA (cytosine-5)-methyltransferase 1